MKMKTVFEYNIFLNIGIAGKAHPVYIYKSKSLANISKICKMFTKERGL